MRQRVDSLRAASTALGGPFTGLASVDRAEIVNIIREERGKR